MGKKFLIISLVSVLMVISSWFLLSSGRKKETGKTEIGKQNKQDLSQTTETVLLTAKEAYEQLAAEAHKWQADAKAYKLEGGNKRENAKIDFSNDGKSLSWRFWFASTSKREIRVYSFRNGKPYFYPEASGGGLKGVSYEVSGFGDNWQIDSNKAFEVVKKEGIVKPLVVHMYAKGNFVTVPKEIRNAANSCNIWWDIWGKDESGNGKRVYLNASSGEVLK